MKIAIWRPRGDEHQLAASLGMCESDPIAHGRLIEAAVVQTNREHPEIEIKVRRWHLWRVVRAMQRAGALNTPDGRALAYAKLEADGSYWSESDE